MAQNRFSLAREARGLNQSQVGIKLDVNRSIVSMWESGKRMPSTPNLLKMATLYKCSVDYLLGTDIKQDTG